MTIVLNENEWAEEMIQSKSLGKKPFETLSRVARYYIDKDYSKKDTRKMLDQFLIQCDPSASITKWSDALDASLDRALKYEAIKIDGINISDKEMSKIDALNGAQLQRLAFTLLCLAKYWDEVNPMSGHWTNSKDSDIMRMANINTSIKRQGQLYHALGTAGMVQFSKKVDNTNTKVCFMEDGETVLTVTDFRNLGYQYMMYHGGPYFECENCGVITKIANPSRGGKQKYCKDCAVSVAVRQRVNSVMRQRGKM